MKRKIKSSIFFIRIFGVLFFLFVYSTIVNGQSSDFTLTSEKQKSAPSFKAKIPSKTKSIQNKTIHIKKTAKDKTLDKTINLSTMNEAKTAYKNRGVIILKGNDTKLGQPKNQEDFKDEAETWGVKNAKTQPTSLKKKSGNQITLIKKAPVFQETPTKTNPKSLESVVINQVQENHAKSDKQILAEVPNERSIDVRVAINDTLPIQTSKTKKLKPRVNPPPNNTSSDIKISVNDDR